MSDIDIDALPTGSRCIDARTPGHQGFINRISNKELYERHPRYPRTANGDPVEPKDLIHFVFVYANEDYQKFIEFREWFKEIKSTIKKGDTVKCDNRESEKFPVHHDDNINDICERAIFILPFLSKSFCDDKVLRFFTSEAIGTTRLDQRSAQGSLENIFKKQKYDAVRPIHTEPLKERKYTTPPGLRMMKEINYYGKKDLDSVENKVRGIIEESIRRFEERKKAMENALTGKDQIPEMEPCIENSLPEDTNDLSLSQNGYDVQEQQDGNVGIGEHLTLTTDGNTSLTNNALIDTPRNRQLNYAEALTDREKTLSQTSKTAEGKTGHLSAEGRNFNDNETCGFIPATTQFDTSLETDNGSISKNIIQNVTQKTVNNKDQNSTDRAFSTDPCIGVKKNSREAVMTNHMSYTGPDILDNAAQSKKKEKNRVESPIEKGQISEMRTTEEHDKKPEEPGSETDSSLGSLECAIGYHESVPRLCKNTLKRSGFLDSGYYSNFSHIYKTCLTPQQGDEQDNDNKPDNPDEELKKFDALLKKSNHNDLRVEDVPRDGDCLYHTFIRNNHISGLPDSPKELRRQLVKYLESNPNTPDGVSYRNFLCLPLDQDHGIIEPEDMAIERVESVENQKELRWQRFLKKAQEGGWGGSLEILGLSQMFDVPVTVLSVMGSRLNEDKVNHTHKTIRNPVMYIGHLRLNGIGEHFVALRPREEKAFQQPAIFQQGEPLRKSEDNSFHCLDGQVIYEKEKLLQRIGCIKVTYIKDIHGTGFRVGSKYFMTAFHVIEDVLIPFWKEVYRRLTEEVQSHMEWTDDNIPVDGAWKLSKLLPFVGSNKRNELMEMGKQFINKRVEIKFGFVRDNMHSFLAQCSYDVAFASPSHDVVILELIEDTNLPNPFHLKNINAAATKLHLIGHPGGKKLEHDPACKIIKDQKELEKLKEKGISFFTTQGYSKDQVEKDYEPCVLSSDRLFFDCSKSVAHGASGSPLIVIINEEMAQVIGMLLRGHPQFYYNYDKKNGDRPDLLVESGISMEKVRSLLDHPSLQELAVNLFPEQF